MKSTAKMHRYRAQCILAPTFKLLEAGFELFVPLLVANIIDIGIVSGNVPYLIRQTVLMGVLALVGFLCTLVAQYFAARAAVGIAQDLRSRLFSKVQKMPLSTLERHGTSTLLTRLTQDVNTVQTGWNLSLRLLLRSPCIVFGATVMAFVIDPKMSLIFLAMIAALSVVVFGIMLLSIPRYQRVQQQLDGVMDSVRQNLTGVRVMRAFSCQRKESEEFSSRTQALMRLQNRVGRLSALLNPLTYALVNAAVILLLWQGGIRIQSGVLTQGQTVALYNYLTQILIELVKLADLIITITKAVASHRRIQCVLTDTQDEMEWELPSAESGNAMLELRNVSFSYPQSEAPALSCVCLTVQKGQTLGIVGGTGSGKSTLVQLLPRFYDASEGTVLVAGKDVRSYSQKQLRSRIGMVPQRSVLFSGTIAENLRYANPEATDQQLIDALKIAQAWDFVSQKEGGLEAQVSAGGKNLSGGQRQRLAIARALVMQPDILVLDDSASALDYVTDAALRRAIAKMEHRPTTVIVSQRTVAVEQADQILVLEDGEVVGLGTHKQLLQSCAIYQEIYASQTEGAGGDA